MDELFKIPVAADNAECAVACSDQAGGRFDHVLQDGLESKLAGNDIDGGDETT